jgi:ubiquinone/menaquinone biosynthesis C-methylase UbiE
VSSDNRPRHLHQEYAAQFGDASVAAAYSNRPPYPSEISTLLRSLITDGPGVVLELGAGTGDITFGLAAHVTRIDAVEPSSAMRAVALSKQPERAANIRWIAETAEAFTPEGRYSLAVAAESLHWMSWESVLPKVGRHLSPRGMLAIVTTRALPGLPWNDALKQLVSEYSTNREYAHYDIVEEIQSRGLFKEQGRQTSSSPPFTQTLDAYIESFHSRNGFSRERMGEGAARSFDAELRALVSSYIGDAPVSSPVATTVVWGQPNAGHALGQV